MKITATRVMEADANRGQARLHKEYLYPTGVELREIKILQRESDFTNGMEYRLSSDNGKNYGEWIKLEDNKFLQSFGEDELMVEETDKIYNPIHKHYVHTHFTRYFIGGHVAAYKSYWTGGNDCFDHQYIIISDEDGNTVSKKLVMYENGCDFDPNNPRNPEFLYKNIGYVNPPAILKCGDIVVPVGVPVRYGCEILGLDVQKVFPSTPDIHRCVMVARGKYNEKTKEYDFSFSTPVILNDLRSSRGIDEPMITELESGRILMVMRGSNIKSEAWKTRIEDGAPAFKWYSYSDDGGKSFTDAEPWRFDDREVIYSAATISRFIRSNKNGKLYWIGNIAPHTAYGNFPRYPLNIAEVDEVLGVLKKDTLATIDTKRDGETDEVQLSNFFIFEDRVTGNLEVTLCKVGQFNTDKKLKHVCESWKYDVELD